MNTPLKVSLSFCAMRQWIILKPFKFSPSGTEVVVVRARGPLSETVVYGIDLPLGTEGVFEIDSQTGNVTVGGNGSGRLVIRNQQPTQFVFEIFAYFLSSGPSGSRVRPPVTSLHSTLQHLNMLTLGISSGDCDCAGLQ